MTEVYAERLTAGKEYQDFTALKLYEAGIPIGLLTSEKYQRNYGENIAGIEIKLDRRLEETGNLYFETHEKSNAGNIDYVFSGIFRKDNAWLWGIGGYRILYIIPKLSLQRLYYKHHGNITLNCYKERNTPTSMGFTLNAEWVEKYLAARVLRFEKKIADKAC